MCVGPKSAYFVDFKVISCILYQILNYVYMHFSTIVLYNYDDWSYFPEGWV